MKNLDPNNDERCPWVVKYKLEDCNIKTKINFNKINTYMKLATANVPDKIEFRPSRLYIFFD